MPDAMGHTSQPVRYRLILKYLPSQILDCLVGLLQNLWVPFTNVPGALSSFADSVSYWLYTLNSTTRKCYITLLLPGLAHHPSTEGLVALRVSLVVIPQQRYHDEVVSISLTHTFVAHYLMFMLFPLAKDRKRHPAAELFMRNLTRRSWKIMTVLTEYD